MSEPTPYGYYPEENQGPYGTSNSSWPNNSSSPYADPTYPNSDSAPYPPPQPNTIYAQPPSYYQPAAQQMYAPPPQPVYMPYGGYRATQTNGPGIAGMVLGIISVLIFWFPFIGLPISIVGLVLSSVGMKRIEGKGFAVAGLVLTIIGVILSACIATFVLGLRFHTGY